MEFAAEPGRPGISFGTSLEKPGEGQRFGLPEKP